MANLTSTLTVRMIDAVTGPARAAANSIRGIGTAVDQTNARRMAIGGAVSTASRDIGRATRDIGRHVTRMSTAFSMPTGFLGWFGGRAVYDFDRHSNRLEAFSRMTKEQLADIRQLAKDLNEYFPFDAGEIMEAASELARAGFNYEQIRGTIRETLNLSLAGDIERQQAADIATNILTAMRLPMKTAEQARESLIRVNDALSYAAANSNTDVQKMGETFKYVGPLAAGAGLSVEEVAVASMVMARNAIKASEAGVAMRSGLVRMVKPVKPMLAALAQMNINIDDFITKGRQISAGDIVSSLMADGVDATPFIPQIEAALNDPKLRKSLTALTSHLTETIFSPDLGILRNDLANAIADTLNAASAEVDFFGFLRALRDKGATVGDITNIFDARQGSRLYTLLSQDLITELDKFLEAAPGTTDWMAGIMMQGLPGDVAALAAAFQNLFLAISEAGVLKTATEAIHFLTESFKSMAQANPKLLETGTYLLIIAGAIGPLGMLLGGVASGFLAILAAFRLMKAAGLFVAGAGAAGILGGGAAAAGGAAAGAAGAAASGGLLRKGAGLIGRGAGALGAGWLVHEALGHLDPKGNLWGLTSGIDKWVEEHFGFNPSKIGGGEPRSGPTVEAARAMKISELEARQADLDEALRQLEEGVHPSMRDQPNHFRDRLLAERAQIEAQINEARTAGQDTGAAFIDGLQSEFQRAKEIARQEMQKLKQEIESTTIRPIILPSIEVPGLRGVHADTGVE